MSRDGPDSATEQHCIVEEGDVIVAASDGLFDNLYDGEIAELVTRRTRGEEEQQKGEEQERHSERTGFAGPASAVLGKHALKVARSCTANSPFAEAM
jgi:serine/threonine protein phosphatase PrpC